MNESNSIDCNEKIYFSQPNEALIPVDLKPRSSVISGKFKNDPEAMREQNLLEKEMEEIRLKTEQLLAKDEEETTEDKTASEDSDEKDRKKDDQK